MPQMRVARIANRLNPAQKSRSVKMAGNRVRRHWLRKRRPAGPGLEFLRGIEQHRPATQAGVDSGLKQPAHLRTTESPLRARLARHTVLLRTQLRVPLSVCFNDLAVRGRIALLREAQHIGPFQYGLHD